MALLVLGTSFIVAIVLASAFIITILLAIIGLVLYIKVSFIHDLINN